MVRMVLLSLPKKQVEEYVGIDKTMKPEDLVYGKYNFNRYGTVIIFGRSYWYSRDVLLNLTNLSIKKEYNYTADVHDENDEDKLGAIKNFSLV